MESAHNTTKPFRDLIKFAVIKVDCTVRLNGLYGCKH